MKNSNFWRFAVAAALLWIVNGQAHAAVIFLETWESPDIAGSANHTLPLGWIGGNGDGGLADYASFSGHGEGNNPARGSQFGWVNNVFGVKGVIYGALGATFAASTEYGFTFWAENGGAASGDSLLFQIGVGSSSEFTSMGEASITPVEGWQSYDSGVVFTTPALGGVVGQAMAMRITTVNLGDAWFDNVTVNANAIPEPTVSALLAISALACSRRRHPR